MAPEQARGLKHVDVRTDLYSVGTLLYECVTGRVPFDGDNFNDLMFKIALAPRPNPLEFCPDLSIPLASIIIKAISADPRERFASAAEFHAALVEWLDTQGVKSVRPPELRRAVKATPRASGSMRARTPAEAPAIVISAEAAHWSDATAAVPSQGATPLAAAATFEPPPHPRSNRGVLATLGAALLIGTVAGAAALRHAHRQGPPGEARAAQVPPMPIQAATTTAVPDPTRPPAVIAETRLEPPTTAALPASAAPRGVYRAPPRTGAHVGPAPKNTPSGPSESPPAPAKNMDSTATPAPPPPPPPAPAAAEPPPKPADTVEGRAIRTGL